MNPITNFENVIDTSCEGMNKIIIDLTAELEKVKGELEAYKYMVELLEKYK